MRSHRQWQDGQRFSGSGIGSSSGGVASFGYQQRDLDQRMRNVDVNLERSKSMKQTKVNVGILKSARQSPVNLDHIFQEDHLSPWLEEIEGPLLDGTQNAQWIPIDYDDDIEEIPGDDDDDSNSGQTPSQGGEDGLSPLSDENSDGNGGGGNQEQVHGISEGSHHSFQEEAYVRHDQNLLSHRMEEGSCDDITGGGSSTSRGRAKHGKSKKKVTPVDYSSSSSGVQSYSDFGFVAPFEAKLSWTSFKNMT
ncbi:hypothetical protein TSUD_242280 [Trifolium subterraneum]|uniref:Uncharacterized protein n=1 Tax=Trifolium subterraneum TaxID=3900 RepID=A0A2Z6NET6_TRISU|nr:hypothetical protein TSUD_242280 [Trifolium subterraneum]